MVPVVKRVIAAKIVFQGQGRCRPHGGALASELKSAFMGQSGKPFSMANDLCKVTYLNMPLVTNFDDVER